MTGGRRGGATETSAPNGRVWRWSAWLAGAAAWIFIVASLLSYDPADAPGRSASPLNDPVENWCGPAGAWIAHHGVSLLGAGLWALIGGAGIWLGLAAAGRRVSHVSLRIIGLAMLALAVSGFQALFWPNTGPLPEGAGGLIAIAGVAELTERFSTLGSALWLGLLAAVGAVVAFDEWLLAIPAAIWDRISPRLGEAVENARYAIGERLEARRERRAAIRENDVDDDETVPLKKAAKKQKKPKKRPAPVEAEAEFEDPDLAVGAEDDDEEATTLRPAKRAGEEDEDDVPGAPQVFDAQSIQEKVARLPVRFAARTREKSTDDHLRDIQTAIDPKEYRFPGLDLLEEPEASYSEQMESFVRKQAEALEEALRVYRIDGEVVGIDSGPVITLYEVRLAPGTKVSALQTVSSDIARALKAVNIRIVPNMAGRDTVGVEVPNLKKEKVRLKELMTHPDYADRIAEMQLPMFLGKDASGDPLIEDLAELPHMLIAGTTGSGKSVCLNTVIMSWLYTKRPDQLKLVLIDPKMVELSAFRDIPHLMCPVVTEMSKAAAILEWAVGKMDERYELLAEAGVRDIASYNDLTWEEIVERFEPATQEEEARLPRKLPYIVFVIDELADMMMTHKEVEGAIVRVAQKARAVGIHLVLATQRPQANVVTGLIKSNMPGRIAFKVASGMDSRIVLDQKGGELLLGQGDMLFLSPRSHKLMRAQGTLAEDKETRRVVRFLKDVASPSFERQLVQLRSAPSEEEGRDGLEAAHEDPLFEKAVEIVLETKRGSVSLLQRRLAIGYTRASRLIDLMGEVGIIGEYKGTVAREVVISQEEWEAMKAHLAQMGEADSQQDGVSSATATSGEQTALFDAGEAESPRAEREDWTKDRETEADEDAWAEESDDEWAEESDDDWEEAEDDEEESDADSEEAEDTAEEVEEEDDLEEEEHGEEADEEWEGEDEEGEEDDGEEPDEEDEEWEEDEDGEWEDEEDGDEEWEDEEDEGDEEDEEGDEPKEDAPPPAPKVETPPFKAGRAGRAGRKSA